MLVAHTREARRDLTLDFYPVFTAFYFSAG